jgi:hypothetical protein
VKRTREREQRPADLGGKVVAVHQQEAEVTPTFTLAKSRVSLQAGPANLPFVKRPAALVRHSSADVSTSSSNHHSRTSL